MKKSLLKSLFLAAALSAQSSFADYHQGDNVKIANWNLQVFGTRKASNSKLMKTYSEILKDYDIVFVQEIRDSSDTSFSRLCSTMPGYSHKTSSRAGRTNSKEQYGILFKKGINLKLFKDFNPDSQNRWERPPVEAEFSIGSYVLDTFNIHTKPGDVRRELTNLNDVVNSIGNVVVLGDLNADCNYYNHSRENQFKNWFWAIKDDEDTTSGNSDCAYDRFILNKDASKEYIRHGIFKTGIRKGVSDHYLVWIEMTPKDR